MLSALYRRSKRRHAPAASLPDHSALQQLGEHARHAARAAVYVALAVSIVVAGSLAVVSVAAETMGLATLLVAWFALVVAVAAAPSVAVRAVATLSTR